MSHKSSGQAIKLKLVSRPGPTQEEQPQMVFSVVSRGEGCEEKLKELVERIGPEMFEGVRRQEDGQLIVDSHEEDQFADADEESGSDLEEIKEEEPVPSDSQGKFIIPVVSMPVFDSYGLPKDGFNYYKFIKNEVNGGDFIAAEPQPEAELVCDSDFGKKLSPQERAVLAALDDADEYESLSDDFLEEAAKTPEGEEEEKEEEFDKVAEEYMKDDIEDEYPRAYLKSEEVAALMADFKRDHPELLPPADPLPSSTLPEASVSLPAPIPFSEDHCLQRILNEPEEDADIIAEKTYEILAFREPEEVDDVESVVSTYTNTDNRPALISVLGRRDKKKGKKEKVEKDGSTEEKPKPVSGAIPENETKEEKKKRKAALKEARRSQRQAKKETKESFTAEKVRQIQQSSGKYDTPQGYSVIKIS